MPAISWVVPGEAATADVFNRPLKQVLQLSGIDPLGIFPGLAGSGFNVKAYGAKGDDINDDTLLIQQALNDAGLIGGTVVTPPGIYKTTAVLQVPSNVTFQNAGGIIKQYTEGAHVISVAGRSNVVLSDLDVTYATVTVRNAFVGIYVTTCTDVQVKNCRVRQGPGLGIYVANSTRVQVNGNKVRSTLADGIHITNGSSAGHVSRDINVSGNIVDSTGDDCIACVSYTAGGTLVNEGITIHGNTITNGAARGIAIAGGKGVTVSANTIRNMAATSSGGIIAILDESFVSFGVTDIVISGNIIEKAQGVTANTRHGIRVYRATGVVVTGNNVSWGVGEGIKVYGNNVGALYCDDVSILNNIIDHTGVVGENGIYAFYARRLKVNNNTIISVTKGFVSFDNVIDYDLTDNTFDEANTQNVGATNLVTVANASNGKVHGNMMKQTGTNFTHGYSFVSAGTVDFRNPRFNVTAVYAGQLTSIGAATVVTPGWGADVGDANVTLTAGVSAETVRYATALTANRVVTLATLGAYQGAKFRIVRSGLGAFTLDVGGLKTIPAGTAASVDVEYRASAGSWALTGYSPL